MIDVISVGGNLKQRPLKLNFKCFWTLINERCYIWLIKNRKFKPSSKAYVSLQLLVQNRKRKWHFSLNFRNGIKCTGAFSKAFGSSEALISVLSKNAHLYDNISNSFQSKTLYIVLIFKSAHLDTNLWIFNLCIYQKTCQQNTNFW